MAIERCTARFAFTVFLAPLTTLAASNVTETRVLEIERGFDLPGLMRRYHVPGPSVAVIDGFKLAWTKAYGVTEPGGSTPVTPSTLFLAGSISKPVTAVAALRLVQKGKLSLDQDVNLRLRTWRIPKHRYAADHPVTLALLLDHTGGFTGGDFFPGYSLDQPQPSLMQILDGMGGANTPPARIGFAPGSRWQYSGHGYLVVQQLMMDTTERAFPALMSEELFERVGMEDSSFEQPLPSTRAAFAGRLGQITNVL